MPVQGFATPAILTLKFTKHRAEFGVATEQEYLASAIAFIDGLRDKTTTWQCQRRNGDLLRYNQATEEFCVLRKDQVIKTYYKPDPAEHGMVNNLEYFRAECRK